MSGSKKKETMAKATNNTSSSSSSALKPEEDDQNPVQSTSDSPRRGGWRSVKYIIANESFEKLASMSLISNMTLYLLTQYNMSNIAVVNVVQIWNGTSNVASIAGALVSDTFLGRFRTLICGSLSSLLGIYIITLTAGIDKLRPHACDDPPHCQKPQGWQLSILFAGLGLLSLGAGGIRPCNIAFGADQFDTNTEKGKAQLQSFFSWWYFTFTIALVVALTGVVYIQTNVSWALGFAIPTICLAFSTLIFVLGSHTYIYKEPQGSIFIDMAKVIVAACRKQKILQGSFYDPKPKLDKSEMEEENKRPVHTERFKCLDKAAMIADPATELDNQGRSRNGWRLCSLQQVENFKCLLGILPVWVTGICCFVVMDQQNTFGVLQVLQMDRSIGPHFKIPPGWMNLTSMIALSIWIQVYESIYIPLTRRFCRKAVRLSMGVRIKIGIFLSILCMVVAAIVEKKRRHSALKLGSYASPTSFVMLLPQFALSGLNEAFAAVAIMEFFTMQMPESMRTVAGAVFFLSLSIANYIGSLVVNVVHSVTSKKGRTPWLGGQDLNKIRLDNYYFLIAALGVLNFLYFCFFADRYLVSKESDGVVKVVELGNSDASRKELESSQKNDDEEKVLGLKRIPSC